MSGTPLWLPMSEATYARPVDGKHDGHQSARPSRADLGSALFYGVVPLAFLLLGGAPWWAAVLVGSASAGIGYYRN